METERCNFDPWWTTRRGECGRQSDVDEKKYTSLTEPRSAFAVLSHKRKITYCPNRREIRFERSFGDVRHSYVLRLCPAEMTNNWKPTYLGAVGRVDVVFHGFIVIALVLRRKHIVSENKQLTGTAQKVQANNFSKKKEVLRTERTTSNDYYKAPCTSRNRNHTTSMPEPRNGEILALLSTCMTTQPAGGVFTPITK